MASDGRGEQLAVGHALGEDEQGGRALGQGQGLAVGWIAQQRREAADDAACASAAVAPRGRQPAHPLEHVVVADGSGQTIGLLGTKRIRVVIRPARGHTSGGTNLLPSTLTPKCSNLRQVKRAGDFEGVVSYGLGLSRKTGFRVFRLSAPTRVVIDVAH